MPTNKKPFYITTTLPYVNADPHIGHALEFIRADIIARFKKLQGHEVFFNTGTDEHGQKIYNKAKELHTEPQALVDTYAAKFKELLPALGMLPEVHFTRTSDRHHVMAAQEFWKLADKNGLIYKKNYSVKYCIGCELEKTESELLNGKCPLHPLQELEIIQEENYFFRFSIYQRKLLDLYERTTTATTERVTAASMKKSAEAKVQHSKEPVPELVIPHSRQNEIMAFVERGLEDFSISRLASKMPWGIPVPGDPTQVMYVWFDALVNYISAIGWPDRPEEFKKWWIESGGVVQYCGKDNLRQQSAMWQAMLMAVGLPPSQTIVINGFVTGEGGIKMSKSLGNTIEPMDVVKEYGTEALRYYVAREIHPFEDSPFTMEKFKDAYNAHLANGLGNLVSRTMKMATANDIKLDMEIAQEFAGSHEAASMYEKQIKSFEAYDIQQASNAVWDLISETDAFVQMREPFKKIKSEDTAVKAEAILDVKKLLARLDFIATMLVPIMPVTAATITDLVRNNKMPEAPLFLRK